MNSKKNHDCKAVYIPFRVDVETDRQITALAAEMGAGISKSEVIRYFLDKGLKSDGYRKDDERLYHMLRDTVQEVIKPHVDRLASISAKATQIDSACFFLLLYVGRLLLPPDEQFAMDDIAARARQLGIEYLQHRGDVDEFIDRANQRMKNI